MTPLEAIQTAHTQSGIRSFRFADIKEFNTFMDSFNTGDYPVNVLEPFESRGNWLNGRRKVIVPLRGWVITRLSADETTDYRSAKLETEYLAPMRALAKKFLGYVVNSDLTDPEVDGIRDTIRPEYAFLSSRLFGVSYTMDWPTIEKVC